jgi:hypothetical protein
MKTTALALALALAASFGLSAAAFAQTTTSTPAPAATTTAKPAHKDKTVHHKAETKPGAKAGASDQVKK